MNDEDQRNVKVEDIREMGRFVDTQMKFVSHGKPAKQRARRFINDLISDAVGKLDQPPSHTDRHLAAS